jgi:hypothetical protein
MALSTGRDGAAKPRRFQPPDSVVAIVVANSAHVSAGDLAEAEEVATDESECVANRERRTAMTIRTQLRDGGSSLNQNEARQVRTAPVTPVLLTTGGR